MIHRRTYCGALTGCDSNCAVEDGTFARILVDRFTGSGAPWEGGSAMVRHDGREAKKKNEDAEGQRSEAAGWHYGGACGLCSKRRRSPGVGGGGGRGFMRTGSGVRY